MIPLATTENFALNTEPFDRFAKRLEGEQQKIFYDLYRDAMHPPCQFETPNAHYRSLYGRLAALVAFTLKSGNSEMIQTLGEIVAILDSQGWIIHRLGAPDTSYAFPASLHLLSGKQVHYRFARTDDAEKIAAVMREAFGFSMSNYQIHSLLRSHRTRALLMECPHVVGVAFGTLLEMKVHKQTFQLFFVWFMARHPDAPRGLTDTLLAQAKAWGNVDAIGAVVERGSYSAFLHRRGVEIWEDCKDALIGTEGGFAYQSFGPKADVPPRYEAVERARFAFIRRVTNRLWEWTEWFKLKGKIKAIEYLYGRSLIRERSACRQVGRSISALLPGS